MRTVVLALLSAVSALLLASSWTVGAQPSDLRHSLLASAEVGPGFTVSFEAPTTPNAPKVAIRNLDRVEPGLDLIGVILLRDPLTTPTQALDALLTGLRSLSPTVTLEPAPAIGRMAVRATLTGTRRGQAVYGDVIVWRQGDVQASITYLGDRPDAGIEYAERQQDKLVRTLPGASSPDAAPSAPTRLRVSLNTPTRLRFEWEASMGAEEYWLYAPQVGGYRRVDSGTASFELSDPTPESYHCLIVVARNATGYSGWSNWACATAPSELGPPAA